MSRVDGIHALKNVTLPYRIVTINTAKTEFRLKVTSSRSSDTGTVNPKQMTSKFVDGCKGFAEQVEMTNLTISILTE
jgi:hypothetical protein